MASYKEGQRIEYAGELDLKIHSKTMPPNDMLLDMDWKVKGDFDVLVSRISEDGSMDLLVKALTPKLTLSIKGTLQGGVTFGMDFDSDQEEPMPHELFQVVQHVFKSLDQGEITVVLDNDGRVSDVRGVDAILKALEKKTGVEGTPDMDRQAIARAFSAATTYLPGHPVKLGESWTSTHELAPHYEEHWSLKSVDGDTLVIQNEAPLTKEMIQGFTLLETGAQIEEGEGAVSETIVLNKSSRLPLSLKGNAMFSAKQTMAEPMEMKSEIQIEYKLKLEKKA